MRALECHDVGDQPVLVVQLLILLGGHRGVMVPTEGVQGFVNKGVGILGTQATLTLELLNQRQCARGENLPFSKDLPGQFTQGRVVDQLQAQQRSKDPERTDMQ
ncbi:hypothetical protein D3C71_1926690 [compost metagenome]